jgi:[acyl-carrier-protein] S-malonyltransferase
MPFAVNGNGAAMPARFAILCSGQGGQSAAMFDLIRKDPQGARILDSLALDSGLSTPLDSLLSDDKLLFSNRYAQPLIVAAGLAAWLAIRSELPPPSLVAGYSVGELTAYGVAESLPAKDMIELARLRAEIMDAAAVHEPRQGLMSVGGIAVEELEKRLPGLDAWIAIDTGFDTAIVGGTIAAMEALQPSLHAAGARTRVLPVGIASHTPLMVDAVAPFGRALENNDFRSPAIPVLAGVSGQTVYDRDTAIMTLQRQLIEPIRWRSCMNTCAEQGIVAALELGPCSALAAMMRSRHPAIECRSLADFRSLEGAVRWLLERVA